MKNQNNISVNKAISVAKRYIITPIILILAFLFPFSIYWVESNHFSKIRILDIIVFVIIVLLIFWNFAIIKWRIWAFENVRNVHELYQKAINNYILFDDENQLEKIKFIFKNDKLKLKAIENKFLEKDIYSDDISVSQELKLFYSKKYTYIYVILSFILTFGIILFYIFFDVKEENAALLFYGIPFNALFVFTSFKLIFRKKPLLIINDEGITNKSGDFFSWEYIDNEIITTPILNSNKSALEFFYFDEKLKIAVSELNISYIKLEKALQTYRIRYENRKTN